ncbi:MAG: bifunctional folylpolyglutamate synthase/dihydrofolate synthase [Bacteroidales bacterium]|nr:bifunctional folylpolyglutamate synthase/dihydrofolate synthase [Bacteroidales bacterium]MCF8455926.1 bifunctional folylpolyglutamate synthase/dihydrofolate synthase [Bacteroidales bacterium]
MNFNEAVKFLYDQLPMFQRTGKAAYKSNLNNTRLLDSYFGSPHRQFKSVHVAGTNGKGSVSHLLASILQTAGYKTGLYTSPHMKSFRERVRVNGAMIPESEVVDFVLKHKAIIDEIKPSFFEMTVAMAFDYFARQQVDIAIVEVGLGGRLDSTNIIDPILSIITNISFDHTEFLGDTIQKIAFEKAGIIKAGRPVIIGESQDEIRHVFIDKARELNSPIFFADQVYDIPYSTRNMEGHQVFNVFSNRQMVYDHLSVELLGMYQKKNVITCLAAIDELREQSILIEDEHIYEALKNTAKLTGLLGRWQVLGANPLIVADSGHNEDGIKQVVDQLNQTAFKKLHIVVGMVNDKNIEKALSLLPKNARYYFTKANIPRALNEQELKTKALQLGLSGDCFPSVEQAINAAKSQAETEDMIFIGGSTFVVAEAV